MYKTYFFVSCGVISATAYGLGYIDIEVFKLLLAVFGFGSVAGLRSAINNLFKKPKNSGH